MQCPVEFEGASCGPPWFESLPDQAEQLLETLLDVTAFPCGAGREPRQFHVPQPFHAVTLPVGVRVDRGVAELRSRLDIEQEQQAVHVPQALQAQLLGRSSASAGCLGEIVPQRADSFVAEQFDRLAQGVLEVGRNSNRVPVAVLVQPVQQSRPCPWHEGLAMEQGRRGLEGRVLPAAQNLPDVEPQQAVVSPFPAFQKHRLAAGEDQDPAWRPIVREHPSGYDLGPGLLQQRLGGRGLAVELRRVWLQFERVFPLGFRIVPLQDDQPQTAGTGGIAQHG